MSDRSFTQLESKRLTIRRFKHADLEPFQAYRADPDVARYQAWENYTRVDAERFYEEMSATHPDVPGKWFQFAIEVKGTSDMIGDLGMVTVADEPRQVMMGITLSAQHQGNGYATEAFLRLLEYAFDDLSKHRVIATTDCLNARSIALLERVGMRREGHYLQNVWFKGAWGDEYQYACCTANGTPRQGAEGRGVIARAPRTKD